MKCRYVSRQRALLIFLELCLYGMQCRIRAIMSTIFSYCFVAVQVVCGSAPLLLEPIHHGTKIPGDCSPVQATLSFRHLGPSPARAPDTPLSG